MKKRGTMLVIILILMGAVFTNAALNARPTSGRPVDRALENVKFTEFNNSKGA